MHELGVDFNAAQCWFTISQEEPYLLIEIDVTAAAGLASALGVPVRRCYISDDRLAERSAASGLAVSDVIAAVLPDPGSTMSGDFGEILTAIFNGTSEYPEAISDPKKWRLKQDRTKPAPYSDVVQMVLPGWPDASDDDRLICAEVKSKATNGTSSPVASAIADSKKDREGRLDKTLVWLREKAILGDLGTVDRAHIDRFINATDFPPAAREFRAVAVISAELVTGETTGVTPPSPDECALIVISVPGLKGVYESVFAAASVSG